MNKDGSNPKSKDAGALKASRGTTIKEQIEEERLSVPTIMPVVPPEDRGNDGHPEIHPHLPQISGPGGGALLLMISPVRTGKSTIISNLLIR
jgi:hypothetical protein